MIKKVLVANRGEVALRIIRAAAESGIRTVAVCSTADRGALYTQLADECLTVGPPNPAESYLHVERLLDAAWATDCDAIHPGYGFLSENADFAQAVIDAGFVFIGPKPDVMAIMGDKARARTLMRSAGVPVVPGSNGAVATVDEALAEAAAIGYPVLLKASAGGGGRGIRRVNGPEEMAQAFHSAAQEASHAFSDGALYVEKYIVNPRHVEVQVLADTFGHAVHLGERACSLQLYGQKMVEEAPAPRISDEVRNRLFEAALRAVEVSGYENVGTVEFILDEDDRPYFIEMNTRLQVEHAVTEMVTGLDLVRAQFRVASGLALDIQQDDVSISGHAMECRIIARDPLNNFLPSTGEVSAIFTPGGHFTRFDTHLQPGALVTPYYDPLLAKLIVRGEGRLDAIRKMRRALEETAIEGVRTNVDLLYTIFHDHAFVRGHYDTSFMEKNIRRWVEVMETTADELRRATQKNI